MRVVVLNMRGVFRLEIDVTVSHRIALLSFAAFLIFGRISANADVLNWQTGETIPGTEDVEPGPRGVFSTGAFPRTNLRYADFSGGLDLTGAYFEIADLSYALFEEANLTDASLDHTILTGADFNDAIIRGATFRRSGENLTFEQLASTASYEMKDLRGIEMNIDMRYWDLSGQDLRDADFFGAFLGGADLTGAIVNGMHFPWRFADAHENDTLMFSMDQLYSTASYLNKNLRRIQIVNSDLAGWDFSGQDLRCSEFQGSNFRDADLTNTDLRSADFLAAKGIDGAIFDENTIYDEWTFGPEPSFDPIAAGLTFQSSLGDFDLNDVLEANDLDMLTEMHDSDRDRGWREISQCNNSYAILKHFYLLDGIPGTEGDHRFWVHELKNTYYGDANLDGEFDSADLVQVFEANEYEDDIPNNSGWADGDWDGDREFTSQDLVLAFQDAGYEQGPRVNALAIPEPSHSAFLCVGSLLLFSLRVEHLASARKNSK